MGVVGNPASDGISEPGAIRHALQRATDDVLQQIDLAIFIPAEPRKVNPILITTGSHPSNTINLNSPENESGLADMANLHNATWQKERATCTTRSPDGNYGAVAGYTWSQSAGSSYVVEDRSSSDNQTRYNRGQTGSRRVYGARVHIVDLDTGKTAQVFDFSELAISKRHEKAKKEILAMTFLANWRFLVAVNGNEVVFWDVERGKELSRIIHGQKAKRAAIGFGRSAGSNYVRVNLDGRDLFYKIGLDTAG
jgi:hypothetical protein